MMSQFIKDKITDKIDLFEVNAPKFGNLPLWFMNYHGSTNIEEIISTIEYAIYAHGISHIILDNLQFILSDQGSSNLGINSFYFQKFLNIKLKFSYYC